MSELPPRKRRRLSSTQKIEDIVSEFDLEISIRERLCSVTQQRIRWLQTLVDGLSSPVSDGSSTVYKSAALDAWDAVNDPVTVLLDRDVPVPSASHTNPNDFVKKLPERPYRPAPQEVLQTSVRQRKAKFIFIRSSNASQPAGTDVLILRCPVCLRTSFTSLQGILNHARLAHKLEWGTHDDCINACAVVNDQGLLIEEGVEVGGNLAIRPSLQRLFNTALGGAVTQPGSLAVPSEETRVLGLREAEVKPAEHSTHISKTLGYHVDTPALAPFLGRTAERRAIKVWDEMEDVDIYGETVETYRSHVVRHNVGRVLTSRNDASQLETPDHDILDDAGEISPERTTSSPSPGVSNAQLSRRPSPTLDLSQYQSTRFHFATRVIVTDKSFYIPPERRGNQSHTHKWMIAVESPSYSLDITTILKTLRVSQAEHQPFADSTLDIPALSCSEPPFVVVGRTSRPFLAKIDLEFNSIGDGIDIGQVYTLEHWVELEQLGAVYAVTGDEQVVDVELDKRMRILPPKKDFSNINAKALWNRDSLESTSQTDLTSIPHASSDPTQPDQLLKEILPRFPMTLKDIKSRSRVAVSQVPYTLAGSPAQFKGLILGRRKAIEWGRARAIRDAYNIERRSHPDIFLLKELHTAEVYDWLEKEGCFIREEGHKSRGLPSTDNNADVGAPDDQRPDTDWCILCGLRRSLQPSLHDAGLCISSGDGSGTPMDEQQHFKGSVICFPMVDITSILRQKGATRAMVIQPRPSFSFNPQSIIAATDPRLTIGVLNLISSLKLSSFSQDAPSTNGPFPLDRLGPSKSAVQARLAPPALLGLVLRRVVKILMNGALEVGREDQLRVMRTSRSKASSEISARCGTPNRTNVKEHTAAEGREAPSRLLTTSHLIRGLQRRKNGRELGTKPEDAWAVETKLLYLCFARMGVPVVDDSNS